MFYENSYIDLGKTAASGQCFRWREDENAPGTWLVPAEGHVARIKRTDENHVEVESDFEDKDFWAAYLDLERDYDAMFEHLYNSASRELKEAYEAARGVAVLNQPFFEMCVSAIVSQNNNIGRIKSIVESMCGGSTEPFPDAEQLAELLREKNLRLGYRQEYLEDFCRDWKSGTLDGLALLSPLLPENSGKAINRQLAKKTAEEIVRELMKFKGVGPKVAACIALFSLGRIDCVPRDVWIKRAEEEFDIEWDEEYAGYQQQLVFFWQQTRK